MIWYMYILYLKTHIKTKKMFSFVNTKTSLKTVVSFCSRQICFSPYIGKWKCKSI